MRFSKNSLSRDWSGASKLTASTLIEREVPLAFLRRTNLAGDGVARLQVEAPDLRRRHVDVVRAGQVVVVGRAQEAEAVGQHFEHAFREDEAALLGLRLENLEDQILLAHAGGADDAPLLGDLRQLLDAQILEVGDLQRLRRGGCGLRARRISPGRGRRSSGVLGCGRRRFDLWFRGGVAAVAGPGSCPIARCLDAFGEAFAE